LEFEPLIFDGCFATYVGLKFAYGWFRLDWCLVWGLFKIVLEFNYGWLKTI
jgi:hypothetical protein